MKITMMGVSGFSHYGSNTQFQVHNSSQSSQYIQYVFSMRSPREIEPIILVILVSCATHIDYAHCMEKTAYCEYRNVMMLFSSTLFLLHTTSRANILLKVFLHHHYVQASPYFVALDIVEYTVQCQITLKIDYYISPNKEPRLHGTRFLQ